MTIVLGNQRQEPYLPEQAESLLGSAKAAVTGYFARRKTRRDDAKAQRVNLRFTPKPVWAHVSQRSWNRHSAYLMCVREMQRDD